MGSPGAKRPLTIIHTNDFHNRLPDDMRAALRRMMDSSCAPTLLLDAGDAGGSTNITFRASGEPILEEMSNLGYAAMTVGNRDFHVSRMGFNAKLSRARFPLLCANIRPSRAESETADEERPLANSAAREPDVRRYVYLVVGQWRVLVIGLTVPMVTPRMWERKVSAYIFDPPIATAARILPGLRARFRPDLTVALTHIGLRPDRELAAAGLGIDLIVGGHSHELLPNGEQVGDTLVVQAGSHGRHVGIVVAEPASDGRPRLSARIESV